MERSTQNSLAAIQAATFEARSRTGKLISTQVRRGRIRVVHIDRKKGGKCTVSSLSDWLPLEEAADAIARLSKTR